MKIYYKKDLALEAIGENQMLFAYDKEENSAKKIFFNATYEEIEKLISKDKSIYEHYGYKENQKIKFFIDIDYKLEEEYGIEYETKDELLNDVLGVVEKYLEEKNITPNEKIIMDASTNKKFSFHIIYVDTVFKDVMHLNSFMMDFSAWSRGKYNKIVDTSIYDNGCFRCVNQSKRGKNNVLCFSDKKQEKQILDTLLLHTNKQDVIIYEKKEVKETKKTKAKFIVPTDLIPIEISRHFTHITKEMLLDFTAILDLKRTDDYDEWLKVAFALKCENKDEYFEIFDTFSKRSKKYDSVSVKNTWISYDANATKKRILTYNSIFKWSKDDNSEEYVKLCKKHKLNQDIEEIVEDTLSVNLQYLLPEKTIKDCAVSKHIKSFLSNQYSKSLLILSPYNTGKTTTLTQIVGNYKRVLFVSYRITLSNNIFGTFHELGFKLYSKDINADRLICQVDSLQRLTNLKYDLIIVDESESVLNHFSSASLKDKFGTFQYFVSLCFNAKKILALDGDLSNRTKQFIKAFGKCSMIENKLQKDKKHFIFKNNSDDFKESITKSLKNKENICLVSMSERVVNDYFDLFSKDYKTIKYTSKTGDNDKALLCEVKKIWSSYQFVIYSPSIESGVDYDIEHFDKIYIAMSANSTSQRGLCQMMNRVRKINNNNVECLLGTIPALEETNGKNYCFDEVKNYYEELMGEKFNFTFDGESIKQVDEGTNFDIYDLVMIHNKVEQLNKNPNCFLPIFIEMLKAKGHTFEFAGDKGTKKKNIENTTVLRICEAEKLSDSQFENLKGKQAQQELEEDDKYKMTKYIYEKTFGICFDDAEKLKQYYNRLNIVSNAKLLLGKITTGKSDSDLKIKETETKIKIIKQIISIVGISLDELAKGNEQKINKELLQDKLNEINVLLQKNKILFGMTKALEIETTKKLIATLNSIFSNFGIEITSEKKSQKIDGKVITKYTSVIAFEEEVQQKLAGKIEYDLDDVFDLQQ